MPLVLLNHPEYVGFGLSPPCCKWQHVDDREVRPLSSLEGMPSLLQASMLADVAIALQSPGFADSMLHLDTSPGRDKAQYSAKTQQRIHLLIAHYGLPSTLHSFIILDVVCSQFEN